MFGIEPNRYPDLSLTRQICDQIRALIENGELEAATRLPSTRQMAQELKVSRNVIIEVYEQLISEGYLESRAGSGTYVEDNIHKIAIGSHVRKKPALKAIKYENRHEDIIDFTGGIPDLKSFPANLWGKYLKLAAENSTYQLFDYGKILGDDQLRNTLSTYVFRVKGIRCHPEQLIITSGSSEGFLLAAKAFSQTYDSVYVEDPTIEFTRYIFNSLNYKVHPIGVDQNGMEVNQLDRDEEGKLILLTPSHQFPTGSILSIKRRQQLIKIADATDSYIIEDDYDSEFRLKGIPVPPLQVLNPSRVIYVGTFSKNLAPGLRLGFLIIPMHLVGIFRNAKSRLNIRTSTIEQRAMACFIADGHLDRHIYKMKNIYRKRRMLLTALLKEHFGRDVLILGDEAGMHLQAEFTADKYSSLQWKRAIKYGVRVNSIENYCINRGKNKNRVVLGYGNLDSHDIIKGIERLHKFINSSI